MCHNTDFPLVDARLLLNHLAYSGACSKRTHIQMEYKHTQI